MHWTGAWILLVFSATSIVVMLVLLYLTSLGRLIHQQIPDRPRRRMFLAAISFFITFLAVRLLVESIQRHIGPFQYVEMGGRHIHHLVWGILILLCVGYLWLAEVDRGVSPTAIFLSRLTSLIYGIGAALTLDEFALWLNLKDGYWSRPGRESIDAIVLFGSLLAAGAWGAPLFQFLSRKRKALRSRPSK